MKTYEEFIAYMVNNHMGHRNPITRAELTAKFGKDRLNRETFLAMWKEGCFVINDMDGRGYYIVDWADKADVARFARYMLIRDCALETEQKKHNLGMNKLKEVAASD